jgi:acyl-CoA reductase-like NAD-dependent aldehyde dehydrogenase
LCTTLHEFYGDYPRQSADFARIVSDPHHRRLTKLLESGEIVTGGQSFRQERYIAPTVLRNVAPDSPVMQEEIFGPILPVLRVPDMESAIEFVNARPKPLALYLFTRRRSLEREVLERTTSGGVCVNATLWHLANPKLPFGGVGESGMGAYHGRHTFEVFSHRKSVLSKPTRAELRFAYPPYSKSKLSLLKRFL